MFHTHEHKHTHIKVHVVLCYHILYVELCVVVEFTPDVRQCWQSHLSQISDKMSTTLI